MNQIIERIKQGLGSQNVGGAERWISLAAGALALGYALRKSSRGKVPLLLGAASLLQRGATGHCALYKALGVDRSDAPLAAGNHVPERQTIAA